MAYVTVPKDLSKIKTKVFFGLTKRQLVCFTPAVLLGVPLFFLLKEPAGNSTATLCMMMVMLPFFLLAMYDKKRTYFRGDLKADDRNKIHLSKEPPLSDQQLLRGSGKAA